MRALWTTLTALAIVAVANVAQACPVCASREEAGSMSWIALGAFVLSPWFIAVAFGIWLRRATREDSFPLPSSETE